MSKLYNACLVSQIYNLFIRIITKRPTKKLELYQPAFVPVRVSTINENTNWNMQIVEHTLGPHFRWLWKGAWYNWPLEDLVDSRIDFRYIHIIKHVYDNASTYISFHTPNFKTERGLRPDHILTQIVYYTPKIKPLHIIFDSWRKIESLLTIKLYYFFKIW